MIRHIVFISLILFALSDTSWFQNTNIYQIYLKPFSGNFRGLIQRVPYLELLGIKTGKLIFILKIIVWLLPIFESQSDHGYDTTNYYKIRDHYGSEQDLKDFVTECQKKGIRVLLDLVANHCGDRHPWFSSRNPNERKDHWFRISDKDEKWGPAWPWSQYSPTWRRDPHPEFDRNRSGNSTDSTWFYGCFSQHMPDFDYNTPESRKEVIAEFTNVMKYWIEKTGVHGYRCDAVRYMVENGPGHQGSGQRDQKETHDVWKEFRANLQKVSSSAVLVAEAPTETYDQMIQYYGNGDEFHGAFHFMYNGALMNSIKNNKRTRNFFKDLHAIQNRLPKNTSDVLFLSNHDHFAGDRVASQLQRRIYKMKAVASLYLLMSGVPTIYYGEEIGMEGAGNDENLRKPMEWHNVENQLRDQNSLLNHYRRLLKLRNYYQALGEGNAQYVRTHYQGRWDHYEDEFSYATLIRKVGNEYIVIIHSFTEQTHNVHIDLSSHGIPMNSPVQLIMGTYSGERYQNLDNNNRNFYETRNHYPWTTKVLFIGDIEKYRRNGKYMTYENALNFN